VAEGLARAENRRYKEERRLIGEAAGHGPKIFQKTFDIVGGCPQSRARSRPLLNLGRKFQIRAWTFCLYRRDRRRDKGRVWLHGHLLGDESSAHVAQSVEHILGKDEVTGSNPVMGSPLGDGRQRDQRRTDLTNEGWK
jgi:hypothetical protein